jgi:hypothetical protein
MKEEITNFKNPIDIDKVAENPSLLPYAHHVGSAIVKPIDKGKTKGLAMTAMYHQTEIQLTQIKEQVETLIRQAQNIHDKIAVSEKIYKADINFKPIINQTYFLYDKNEIPILSLIGPKEWGKKIPYQYIASVKLLADHTWKIMDAEENSGYHPDK